MLFKMLFISFNSWILRALHSVSAHPRTFRSELKLFSKMKQKFYIQLIFLCVVNIIFAFSGIVLNTLVIVSIWKSSQLRKKLCHFMIMMLSCFDLVSVVTNHSALLVFLISCLREDCDLLITWMIYMDFVAIFLGFSFDVLLVMSIERYLGAYYPIFHHTSVTRRRLLILLAILLISNATFDVICANSVIISRTLSIMIYIIAVFPPLLYLNFKLFKISREVRRRSTTSPEKRATVNLKSISTCLLVVACLVVLSIAASVSIILNMNTENKDASDARLSYIWAVTIFAMNCTFNSLVFFWKSKVLRTEGIKTLKTLKDRLNGSSQQQKQK